MCYANSSTSVNIDLEKRYQKVVPEFIPDMPIFYASGFDHPTWRIVTTDTQIQRMNWGLVPFWFKGQNRLDVSNKTLNARIETLEERSSFKHLWNRQHCLVPSTGFFDWQHDGKNKIPYFIRCKEYELFSLAGMYDTWLNPQTHALEHTFTIVTCEANQLMAEIHNVKKRMPLILTPESEDDWLSGNFHWDLSKRISSDKLAAHSVDKRLILSPQANNPEIHKEFLDFSKRQTNLFD
jgi:putative SOS response-associated peptidase YedK